MPAVRHGVPAIGGLVVLPVFQDIFSGMLHNSLSVISTQNLFLHFQADYSLYHIPPPPLSFVLILFLLFILLFPRPPFITFMFSIYFHFKMIFSVLYNFLLFFPIYCHVS